MKLNTKKAMFVAAALCMCAAAGAVCENPIVILPRIGGGATTGYPMIMPEIHFNSQSVLVVEDIIYDPEPIYILFPTLDWFEAPVLRALECPYIFEPNSPADRALTGKAYNYQYGWDSQFLDESTHPFPTINGLPSGVWIQVLQQSPELDTYDKDAGYVPIFGTPNPLNNNEPSPDIWYWNKGMRHNAYAVPEDVYGRFFATYKLYLGYIADGNDFVRGDEIVDPNDGTPLYDSAIYTQQWLRPCPYIVSGDINSDCRVNFSDFSLLAAQWLTNGCAGPGWCDESDIDHSTTVELPDALLIAENWLVDCQALPLNPACVPR